MSVLPFKNEMQQGAHRFKEAPVGCHDAPCTTDPQGPGQAAVAEGRMDATEPLAELVRRVGAVKRFTDHMRPIGP